MVVMVVGMEIIEFVDMLVGLGNVYVVEVKC